MTFYNRNGILYVRINDKRVSTKLKDTAQNRRLVKNRYKHDEFFEKFNCNKNVPLFIDLCKDILSRKVIKHTSYLAYQSLLNSRIIPYFKETRVNEIKPLHILEFYETFNDSSTLNTCISILKPAFQKAVVQEYITVSPVLGVAKPKFKSEYSVNPFSIEQINTILSHDSQIKNLLGVLFYTGIRTGEALGLKWSDINFNNFEISINRTRTQGFEQTPKTKSSIRTIDMLPQAEYFLSNQRLKTGLMEYIFVNKDNKPYGASYQLKYAWDNLFYEYRELYQTRHSFASNMLSNGEDLMWVSATLGHRSPSITLDKYGRYIRTHRTRKTTFLDTKSAQYA